MANSSDWIAALGRAGNSGHTSDASPDRAGWIAALALSEPEAPAGFQEALSFAPWRLAPDPAISTQPDPDPEPEPASAPPPGADSISPEDEAYMRGYAQGHAEAARAGEDALASEQARYRDLRIAFRALDSAAMEALAQDLNATVLALCEQVLGEYAADSEALMVRCQAAARRLGAGPRALTMHLNPATLARIDALSLPGWTIAEDLDVLPGALRLTSADGCVRDGPDDWKRALKEALGAEAPDSKKPVF